MLTKCPIRTAEIRFMLNVRMILTNVGKSDPFSSEFEPGERNVSSREFWCGHLREWNSAPSAEGSDCLSSSQDASNYLKCMILSASAPGSIYLLPLVVSTDKVLTNFEWYRNNRCFSLMKCSYISIENRKRSDIQTGYRSNWVHKHTCTRRIDRAAVDVRNRHIQRKREREKDKQGRYCQRETEDNRFESRRGSGWGCTWGEEYFSKCLSKFHVEDSIDYWI